MRLEIRKSCWWPDITKREILGGLLKVNLLVAVFGWLFYGEGVMVKNEGWRMGVDRYGSSGKVSVQMF